MPVNYDEIRAAEDMSFIIRGETFEYKDVPHTVLSQIEQMQAEWIESAPDTTSAAMDFSLARLLLLLPEADHERFTALVEREEDPVTYREITGISRRGYELMTGFPTMPPTPSEAGRGRTAGPLKAA